MLMVYHNSMQRQSPTPIDWPTNVEGPLDSLEYQHAQHIATAR